MCSTAAPAGPPGPPRPGTKAKKGEANPSTPPSSPDAGLAAFLPEWKPFRWDVPKVVSEVEVPALFESNGIPNRMHVVVVALPWEETFWHFYRSFKAQGLFVAPPEEQMKLGDGQVALTGFHAADEVSYTVILTPYPNGTTSVIMGEAYWKGNTFRPANAFAPVFPGGENLFTQNLETGLSMNYRVKAKPEEVVAFYKQELSRFGFTRQADGTFTKGSEIIHVVANARSGDPYTDVALVRLSAEAPPSGPAEVTRP